jgi:hypothetical protein
MRITAQIVLLFIVSRTSGVAQDARPEPLVAERQELLANSTQHQDERFEEYHFLEKANAFVRQSRMVMFSPGTA